MRKFYSQNVLSTHLSTIFHYTTLFRSLFHGCGRIEKRIGNVHRAQQGLGDVPALRLPGVTLAKRTAIGDEHQQRDLVKMREGDDAVEDRKSTRLNSSHRCISYAVFCLKKKK